MRYLVSTALLGVGVIHLLPISGVLGPSQLQSLYGLAFNDANAAILMRHRAVLFGLMGFFQMYAAFRPAFQPAAFGGGLVSVVSFLWLAGSTGGYNTSIARVVTADWLALALLIAGIAGSAYTRIRSAPPGGAAPVAARTAHQESG